ncbi:MAG: hypothetical protein COY82_00615 [Parcubacteria group bacterium CG_4_10_14_0_8_um_filter_35_7]|nr:MAG: hypothetical protein COY82_00615 [Parcubacteria group bacterium CG_4_10_14_0_8_um_filter_35_7]
MNGGYAFVSHISPNLPAPNYALIAQWTPHQSPFHGDGAGQVEYKLAEIVMQVHPHTNNYPP